MSNLPAPKVNLVEDSRTHILAIAFPRTNSQVYPLAVSIALGAAKHDTMNIGRTVTHLVAFARNRDDAGRALALLGYINTWKSIQIYAGGKLLQNIGEATSVLRCYVESTACDDWRAHCLQVIDDPSHTLVRPPSVRVTLSMSGTGQSSPEEEEEQPDRYMFPCRLLYPTFRFQIDHPASFRNQIQAAAVSRGCDWCPHFKADHFSKLTTPPSS